MIRYSFGYSDFNRQVFFFFTQCILTEANYFSLALKNMACLLPMICLCLGLNTEGSERMKEFDHVCIFAFYCLIVLQVLFLIKCKEA